MNVESTGCPTYAEGVGAAVVSRSRAGRGGAAAPLRSRWVRGPVRAIPSRWGSRRTQVPARRDVGCGLLGCGHLAVMPLVVRDIALRRGELLAEPRPGGLKTGETIAAGRLARGVCEENLQGLGVLELSLQKKRFGVDALQSSWRFLY